jgi:uncharacterized protein
MPETPRNLDSVSHPKGILNSYACRGDPPLPRVKMILGSTAHRPWPLPSGPWIMAQVWHELLFAHWPIDAAALRSHLPAKLQIDTFDGKAWVGIIPFRMSGVRPRGLPPLPWLSAFPELNVRTYVIAEGKPGVWFFSLDAANPIAVTAARLSFHLPYFNARMVCRRHDDTWIHYQSERTHRHAPAAILQARYAPVGSVFHPQPGSLEHFLSERYCLYSTKGVTLFRGEIHHPPWSLQSAEAHFDRNTMAEASGLSLPNASPLLHFARRQDMLAWAPHRIA